MLKHHRSAPSNFLSILKQQLSAVLHHNFFDLSLLLQHPLSTDSKFLRSPMAVQTTNCDTIKKLSTKQHHHEREPNGKTEVCKYNVKTIRPQ
jgi:hypothetical protein